MRLYQIVLLGGLCFTGCKSASSTARPSAGQPAAAKTKPTRSQAPTPSLTVTNRNQVITLTDASTGKVAAVNAQSRFAVLEYSLSRLPAVGDQLVAFRQGLKVGVLKVSGPVLNNNIVADLVEGEVQAGDEVRKP